MIGSPVSLPLRDGVELSGLLWSPSGNGPFPALLMRQPYGACIASTVVYAHPSWYAKQGYLVLVLDVRGRGNSGGEFSGFATEATDGDDAMAWLKAHPLCNGQVGSYGFSYQGLTQLLGSDNNLLPDALAPAMCGLDERLHWASEGGAHWWIISLSWGLQLAAESCRRRGDQQAWQAIKNCLAGAQQSRHGLALLQQHDPSNPVLQWLLSDPSQTEGWQRHQPSPERLRQPMQLLEGWCDPYLRGGLDLWQQSLDCGGSPELIIGPWSHLSWDRRVGSSDLGPEACGRVDQWQLAFFDQHLRGQQRPEQPSCWAYDLLSHQWSHKDPRLSPHFHWALSSHGLAASRSDEGELKAQQSGSGSVVWVHDPWRPVPGRGGHLGLDAGLCDRADLDARADVACFTTAPLQQPLELWGQFELLLNISSDQNNFDLCGAISVLRAGESQVLQLCTGMLRVAGDNGQQPLQRSLSFQPLLASLEQGDRLRLSLAGSAWPQISCNPKITTLIADLSSSRLQLKAMAVSAAED